MDTEEAERLARSWMDDWLLGKQMAIGLLGIGLNDFEATQAVTLVKALIPNQDWYAASSKKQATPETRSKKRAFRLLSMLLQDPDVQRAMGVNRYDDILWYNKESFDALLTALFAVSVVDGTDDPDTEPSGVVKKLSKRAKLINKLRKADKKSEYEVEKLLASLG